MTAYLADPDVTLYHGDCLEVLRDLPSGSVHMCATSPPFYGLRDYGTGEWEGGDPDCDHVKTQRDQQRDTSGGFGGRDLGTRGEQGYAAASGADIPFGAECGKCGARRVDRQIGLEETPDQWVERLVAVFREVRRVLRDDGTLWVEIGDSYGGGGPGAPAPEGHDYARRTPVAAGRDAARGSHRNAGTKPKDLLGQPWLLAFALRADGWWLRSEIIWARPNPMPESVGDRPTKAHSTVFLLSKQPRYFYDADAIRQPYAPHTLVAYPNGPGGSTARREGAIPGQSAHNGLDDAMPNTGANARSVWTIPTEPTPFAHFATWPQALVRRMILAGTSERGCCPECGAPWVRDVERTPAEVMAPGSEYGHGAGRKDGNRSMLVGAKTETLGWSPSCACDGVDRRLVLTPTGERAGDDPTMHTGRKGMNRTRGTNEGTRPITRYEQAEYARQLRESPHKDAMREQAGEAFAHYIRTDDSGARPIPDRLLDGWLGRGWLVRVTMPECQPPAPVPCTVLDPFAGSGTTSLVARNHGRHSIGIELNEEYLSIAARRLQQLTLFADQAGAEAPAEPMEGAEQSVISP